MESKDQTQLPVLPDWPSFKFLEAPRATESDSRVICFSKVVYGLNSFYSSSASYSFSCSSKVVYGLNSFCSFSASYSFSCSNPRPPPALPIHLSSYTSLNHLEDPSSSSKLGWKPTHESPFERGLYRKPNLPANLGGLRKAPPSRQPGR